MKKLFEFIINLFFKKPVKTEDIPYFLETSNENEEFVKEDIKPVIEPKKVTDISEKGLNLIKSFEGLFLEAYICPAGVVTIGYGTTKIDKKPIQLGTKITEKQAEEYLRQDVEYFEQAVKDLVKIEISQNQFDALVSFTYNLGKGNLSRSTLLKRVNEGKFDEAADEFLKWNKAGGVVLKGLVRRREVERELFFGRDVK